MDDDSFHAIERQITRVRALDTPRELCGVVLSDVQRELRAARWDRRLARAAVVMLVVGLGLNLVNGLSPSALDRREQLQVANVRPAIVETAIVVAEASDAITAQQIARQIAAMSGHKLTDDEEAAIDAATRRAPRGTSKDRG